MADISEPLWSVRCRAPTRLRPPVCPRPRSDPEPHGSGPEIRSLTAFDEILPPELWASIAAQLSWPDLAFFAATCKGFAAAAMRNRKIGARRVLEEDREWTCFATSPNRIRTALSAGRLDDVPYNEALLETLDLGGRQTFAALVAAVSPPGPSAQADLLLGSVVRARKDLCIWVSQTFGLGAEAARAKNIREKICRVSAGLGIGRHAHGGEHLVSFFLGAVNVLAVEPDSRAVIAARVTGGRALRCAAYVGDASLCEWVIDEFGPTSADACSARDVAIHRNHRAAALMIEECYRI